MREEMQTILPLLIGIVALFIAPTAMSLAGWGIWAITAAVLIIVAVPSVMVIRHLRSVLGRPKDEERTRVLVEIIVAISIWGCLLIGGMLFIAQMLLRG